MTDPVLSFKTLGLRLTVLVVTVTTESDSESEMSPVLFTVALPTQLFISKIVLNAVRKSRNIRVALMFFFVVVYITH